MIESIILVGAYLTGAIPFGLLIPRLYGVPDIRKVGSGNIGATNVLRNCGVAPALIVTALDIAKGVLPVLAASLVASTVFPDREYLRLGAGLAAILGHIFPVYLGFRGGKGVNTALGAFLTLTTISALIALAVFIVTLTISRFVSLGSILAATAFLGINLILYYGGDHSLNFIYVPISILLLGMILFTHRSNIKRLLSGTENRFSVRGRSAERGPHA